RRSARFISRSPQAAGGACGGIHSRRERGGSRGRGAAHGSSRGARRQRAARAAGFTPDASAGVQGGAAPRTVHLEEPASSGRRERRDSLPTRARGCKGARRSARFIPRTPQAAGGASGGIHSRRERGGSRGRGAAHGSSRGARRQRAARAAGFTPDASAGVQGGAAQRTVHLEEPASSGRRERRDSLPTRARGFKGARRSARFISRSPQAAG